MVGVYGVELLLGYVVIWYMCVGDVGMIWCNDRCWVWFGVCLLLWL